MTEPTQRQTALSLFLVLLIRVIPVFIAYSLSCKGLLDSGMADPLLNLGGAREILKTGTNPFNFFPPLNFLFIAGLLHVSNGSLLLPLIGIALVGWLTTLVVYLTAEMLFGKNVALLAAIISGLYPNSIFFGMSFYSETLGTFWIAVSFFMVVKYLRISGVVYLIMAGILWGLASQTRGGLHYFALFVCIFIMIQQRFQNAYVLYGHTSLYLLSTFLTIIMVGSIVSPIQGESSVNSKSGIGSVIHGANRITTSCADYGHIRGNIFYEINNCGEKWPEGSQLYSEGLMRLGTMQIFLKLVDFISENPISYIKNSFIKLSCFWSPNQFLIHLIKTKFYYKNKFFIATICFMISAWYVLVLCGGFAGLFLSGDSFRRVFCLFIVYYCVLIFLTVGNTKLRVPLEPFFVMYFACFIGMIRQNKVKWKKLFLNKAWLIIILIFFGNSIYKYQEITIPPGEVFVRQIELCRDLGFSKTAMALVGRYKEYGYYTAAQKGRLAKAEQEARDKLRAGGVL